MSLRYVKGKIVSHSILEEKLKNGGYRDELLAKSGVSLAFGKKSQTSKCWSLSNELADVSVLGPVVVCICINDLLRIGILDVIHYCTE